MGKAEIGRVVLVALVLVMILSAGVIYFETLSSPNELSEDDYVVFSALLDSRFQPSGNTPSLILDHTVGNDVNGRIGSAKQCRDKVETQVSSELQDNFVTKNQTAHALTASLIADSPYLFLTSSEAGNLWQWDQEKRADNISVKYPNSRGLISFSAVGFERDHSQAFVYVSEQAHGIGGGGSCLILKRENGVWKLYKEIPLWIS